MPSARIYKSPKTAMQSGKAKTGLWWLEISMSDKKFYDSVMGWTGSDDMGKEIVTHYETLEDAIKVAKSFGCDPVIENPPPEKPLTKKSYADNFRNSKPPLN